MTQGTCTVDGCTTKSRSANAEYCGKHYHRLYRHGDLHRTARGHRTYQRKYRIRYSPHHPLAMRNGTVYVHRAVLYDTIGAGPHPCHWCATPVHWHPTDDQPKLVTDHLDSDGSNNIQTNLVPSCLPCNTARGNRHQSQQLRAAGWFCNNDTIARLAGTRGEGVTS